MSKKIKTKSISELRANRTSVKWANCDADTLPMFIAEMDFESDERIVAALTKQVQNSDLGYARDISGLAHAFATFAKDRWGWEPDESAFFSAPDVSFGVKAALRHFVPKGGRVILTTPVYPSFFQYLKELQLETIEIPLVKSETGAMRIDTEAIERAFTASEGEKAHAIILSNPHNPHGIVHTRDDLMALAKASANSGALVVSDEIHAPLVHDPKTFNPFAPIAEELGATAVVATSASKGWNIAGTKCALVYAPRATVSESFREALEIGLGYSASILGRTAGTVAFAECSDWLDAACELVKNNALLLDELLSENIPSAKYDVPDSSYLAWIDLRNAGLGEVPAETIAEKARVIVSDGAAFGKTGTGFIRLNLGCTPEVLEEAIKRIAAVAD